MTTWKLVEHAVLMAGIACSACAYAAAPGGAADNPAPTAEANEAGGGGSVALSPPAAETAPEANPEAWRLELATYIWLSSITSTTEAGGKEMTTTTKFKDILDTVDFAGFTHFEAQRGNWGLFTELDFVKISAASDVRLKMMPLIRVNTAGSLKETMFELGVLRSFDGDRVGFDALAGARYVRLDADARFGPFDSGMTKDWVDPIVGGRLRFKFSEKWGASIRGDVGGFGIGSELTTNAALTVGYQISERYSVGVGYRYLRIEDDAGRMELTSETYGPAIGIAIRF